MEEGKRAAAIVLAAGSGKRMGSSTKKQYMQLLGKPVIFYALEAFQKSFIDEIILVVSAGDTDYCRKEIVEQYGFHKVRHIVEGGRERYHSVAAGLRKAENCDFVFIHDGARPMVTQDMLDRLWKEVQMSKACVAGMPVKDTIKLADENNNIEATPDRRRVWMVQTPQVFDYQLIRSSYEQLLSQEQELSEKKIQITDDAMVVEQFGRCSIRMVQGSYENIKITTPEDIQIAETFLRRVRGSNLTG